MPGPPLANGTPEETDRKRLQIAHDRRKKWLLKHVKRP